MLSSARKRGRPTAIYTTSWGEAIQGLSRRADKRWKISANGQTFVEPDERLAIARFMSMTRAAHAEVAISDPVAPESLAALIQSLSAPGDPSADAIPAAIEGGKVTLLRSLPEAAMWAWLREQILSRPGYVARATGIEQIGYLTDLKRPAPPTLLADLLKLYRSKPGLRTNDASRAKLFWDEFTAAVGVEAVGDIDHENVAAYEKSARSSALALKSVKHRFAMVRGILRFAIKRGVGIDGCRRALDICGMLETRGATTLDPNPISPAQFWAIHGKAIENEDQVFAALMLMALNCCMYGSEAGALRWNEVNLSKGTVVATRSKTQVARIAMLWPETIAALKQLPRERDTIFNTRIRSFTAYSVVDSFARYRADAGMGGEVVFGMIRDAAYTTACENVDLDKAKILGGHRLPGLSDHYIKRNPKLVASACEAIRLQFFPK